MNLKDLSNVHSWRNAQWVKYDIKRTAIRKEWHIFNRKYSWNDTLVTMTTSHLITNANLSLLCNIYTNRFVNSWWEFISVLSCKCLNSNDDTISTMRYLKWSISYFSCFLTKDSSKKSLFSSKLCLSLRSNLSNKNISGSYLSTNADNTVLIKILYSVWTCWRKISCNLFRS